MKLHRSAGIFIAAMVFMGAGSQVVHADGLVIFQAESGVLGSDIAVSNSGSTIREIINILAWLN